MPEACTSQGHRRCSPLALFKTLPSCWFINAERLWVHDLWQLVLRRNQCRFCSSRAQDFGSTNAGLCTTDIMYVHALRLLLLGEFSVVHTSVCGDAELDNAAGKKASRHASDGSARLYESEEAIHKEEENGTQEFASLRPSHMPNGEREVDQVQVMHAVEHIEEALPHQWDGCDPHHRTRQHRYHSRQVRNSIVFPFTQLPHATARKKQSQHDHRQL